MAAADFKSCRLVTGRVDVPATVAAAGFEVPMAAVFQPPGGGSSVWVIDEGTITVRLHAVQVGEMTARGVLVKGLEPGEVIAVAGVHFLEEGQTVRILGDEEGAP